MRQSLKNLFSVILSVCLVMLVFSVVHAEQAEDIENPENESAENICPVNEAIVPGTIRCCPNNEQNIVNNACSPCPANQSMVNNERCCPNNQPYLVGTGAARACNACPANQSMVNNERCCPNNQPYLVGTGAARACNACPANQSMVNNERCCPNNQPYLVGTGAARACNACPANQSMVNNERCCPNNQPYLVGTGAARACNACPVAGQSLVSGLCCPADKPYVVGSGSARACNACPVAGQSLVSGLCCPADKPYVVGSGSARACNACPVAGQSLVSGLCCPADKPYVVGSGSARACNACPVAGQSLVSGLCCPADKPYVVGSGSARACNACPVAGQSLVSGLCCPADKPYVVGSGSARACNACPVAGQSLVSGLCCPADKPYVVGSGSARACNACPVAGQSLVSGLCCPADKPYVVGSGSARACNACPVAGQSLVSGLCCPADKPYVVGSGSARACNACPVAGQSLVSGLCCPADKPYVVGSGSARACNACPVAGQSLVSGLCCPADKPYVVGSGSGKACRACPAGRKEISGQCCAPTDKFVVDGVCSTCNYYSMDFTHNNGEHVSVNNTKAKDLSCFDDIFNTALNALYGGRVANLKQGQIWTYSGNHGTSGWFTSLLWEALKKHNNLSSIFDVNFFGNPPEDVVWETHKADNNKAKEAINCTGTYTGVTVNGEWQIGGAYDRSWAVSGVGGEDGCKSGSMYLDKNCKFVDATDAMTVKVADRCGEIKYDTYIETPVSLVWTESYKSEASTLVNFKLNPHSESNTWLWRGSESLPLLVYDPEHKGVIDSATQLFGSWTFGGNGLASLIEGNEKGTPWKDGYEALSKMDKDLDGKVSGSELQDLGLWFDKNRDGISQAGEVKTLSEVSVNSLYYKADKTEKGSIIASKGYEREVDGNTIVASSMDWSEKELKEDIGIMLESKQVELSVPLSTDELIESEYAKVDAPELYGIWKWIIKDNSGASKGSGVFAFDEAEKGVAGATITQLGMSGLSEISSRILFTHFLGSTTKNAEDLVEIKFSFKGESGATLNNTATLSKDGTKLLGKTVVTGSSVSAADSFEYAWTAERLTGKK